MKKALRMITAALLCAATVLSCAGCSLPGGEGSGLLGEDSGLLKDVYSDYFPIGAAVKTGYIDPYEDLMDNFNSVTMEYEMKWAALQPDDGRFAWDAADAICDYAVETGKFVRGHCLVWYKALPSWVLAEGTTKEQALERVREHCKSVVTYYGEKYPDTVYCWDVVNEALADNPTAEQVRSGDYYRTGKQTEGSACGDWYALCGKDFIKEAFIAADEARNALGLDIKLYYNDYGLNIPAKREACLEMLNELISEGVPIDGVGMQAHYYLGDFSMSEFEKSVSEFTSLGLDVQLTELDISIYPYGPVNEVYDELPETLDSIQATMYGGIFEVARRYSTPAAAGHGTFKGISLWGIADDLSWLDESPVKGRKNWPLLFDEMHEPKTAYFAVTDFK